MRPIQSPLNGAAGAGPWIPVDAVRESFALGLSCDVSAGSTLTYKVQYTVDDLRRKQVPTSIARAATVATVVLPNHMLAVGDSIVVEGNGAPLDGTYDVATVTDLNTFTYTVANSGVTANGVTATVVCLRTVDHATITGKSAKFADSLFVPATAVRLNNSAWTAGFSQLSIIQGHSA